MVCIQYLFCLFIAVVLPVQARVEGDICTLNNNKPGTCKIIHECSSAIQLIQDGGQPVTCGFRASDPIVCCARPEPQTTNTVSSHYDQVPQIVEDHTTRFKPLAIPQSAQDFIQAPNYRPTPRPVPPSQVGVKSKQKCVEFSRNNFLLGDQLLSSGDISRMNVSICPTKVIPLIIRGPKALPNWYRYAAVLGYGQNKITWRCLGSLINEQFVLTSVSCTNSPNIGPLKKVRLGDQNDPRTYVEVDINEIITHPDYVEQDGVNNLALLKLKSPVRFNRHILPACLPTNPEPSNANFLAVEWGMQTNDRHDNLMEETARLCKEDNMDVRCNRHNVHICVTRPDERLCVNCEGGLLNSYDMDAYCMQQITGILTNSWCDNPHGKVVSKYTRVYSYLQWIESYIWADTENTSASI